MEVAAVAESLAEATAAAGDEYPAQEEVSSASYGTFHSSPLRHY
jgi:hypothetical protein